MELRLALKNECPQGQALQATGTCCSHLGHPLLIVLVLAILRCLPFKSTELFKTKNTTNRRFL